MFVLFIGVLTIYMNSTENKLQKYVMIQYIEDSGRCVILTLFCMYSRVVELIVVL